MDSRAEESVPDDASRSGMDAAQKSGVIERVISRIESTGTLDGDTREVATLGSALVEEDQRQPECATLATAARTPASEALAE
jgi:hypothetical protein